MSDSLFFKSHIATSLSEFELRKEQLILSEAIESTIKAEKNLLAEAGTGVGKTLAYLLPALSLRKKVCVSTATKHLQDQLFFKDILIARKALSKDFSACLLKGRSNYLCNYRFKRTLSTNDLALSRKQLAMLKKVQKWADETLSGDLSEVVSLEAEDFVIKQRITSTKDNCLGKECADYEACFFKQARQKAKKSDLIIVNHALLMADAVLKEDGFGEILPDVDVVVVDEAHRINQTATDAFSRRFGSYQVDDYMNDVAECLKVEGIHLEDKTQIRKDCKDLRDCIDDFLNALQTNFKQKEIQLYEIKQVAPVYDAFQALVAGLHTLLELAKTIVLKYPSEEALLYFYEQTKQLTASFKQVLVSQVAEDLEQAMPDIERSNQIRVLRFGKSFFSISQMPIHLGDRFQNIMQLYAKSWIFVSATLAVKDSFDYFCMQMGIAKNNVETLVVNSPFAYEKQAVMCVLDQMPDIRAPNFIASMLETSLPMIEKLGGRTFILFTSHQALQDAIQYLQNKATDFHILYQGKAPKAQLIADFQTIPRAILLGTKSFWEGVDVKGDALSCLIFDKIPFPSPADIKIKAQEDYFHKQGLNVFTHAYLPVAATWLKQGVGRLIRAKKDKGVILFADQRLLKKDYGQVLLDSLPPIKRADISETMRFIETLDLETD